MKKIDVDQQSLKQLATTLHGGADEVSEAASSMTTSVDAGMSSGTLGAAMAALAKATACVVADTERSADIINTSNGSYGSTENTNKAGLNDFLNDLSGGSELGKPGK